MVALSGVGVASMLSGANGVPVPLAGMLGADLHTAWLANRPAADPRPGSRSSALTPRTTGSRPAGALAADPAPNIGQTAAAAAAVPSANGHVDTGEPPRVNPSAGVTEDGKVILNLASVEDLRHLPGIGSKRADAILVLRARLGRFKAVNDLLRVKGIGVRGLKKIMPHVVLDAPKPAA